MPFLSAADSLDRRIADAIRAIPTGQIASYSGIGQRVGLNRGGRRVARMLAGNDDPTLPWHRVLRAGGRIAFAPDSAEFSEQARRLREEGLRVVGARVFATSRVGGGLDEEIWGE
ncbi:MAG: MGMT family protein [Pseudomarimonas sp.]